MWWGRWYSHHFNHQNKFSNSSQCYISFMLHYFRMVGGEKKPIRISIENRILVLFTVSMCWAHLYWQCYCNSKLHVSLSVRLQWQGNIGWDGIDHIYMRGRQPSYMGKRRNPSIHVGIGIAWWEWSNCERKCLTIWDIPCVWWNRTQDQLLNQLVVL